MNRYRHAHPIDILLSTARYLGLLILPLLRAAYTLLFTLDSLYSWIKGAWFDILTLLLILGLGAVRWFRTVYRLEPDGIRVRQGVLFTQERFLPYGSLSVIAMEAPWYLVPLRAVHITADTNGGFPTEMDFSMTVNRREFLPFLTRFCSPIQDRSDIRRVYSPSSLSTAVLSLITSSSLTGVLFAATFFSGIGKVLGKRFEQMLMTHLTTVLEWLTFGIPPFAALIAFIILGGWLVSFIRNLLRYLRFSAVQQGGVLKIQSGIFTRRVYGIAVRHINLIEMRQSLITKLLGLYSAFIHVNGYGKKKDELSVLMPSCRSAELTSCLSLLLLDFPVCAAAVRPKRRHLPRFLIPPLSWIAIVGVLWFGAWSLFPSVHGIILYLGIMAELPCIWFLFVKIASFSHTGVGIEHGTYTLRYSYGYRFKTVSVPEERVVRIDVRRNVWQIASGCCDLIFYTFSEGRKRHVVPNLPYKEAVRLVGKKGLVKPLLVRWRSKR